jgi:hypothetical protein
LYNHILKGVIVIGLFGKKVKKEVTELKAYHRSGLNGYGWATTELKLDDENKCITMEAKKLQSAHLNYDQIISIDTTTEEKTKEKSKSVVGRAVVGGALLGPVGAVVGGMSGTGTNKTTKTSYYMVINYKSKNEEIKELKFALYGGPWADFIWSVRHRIEKEEVEEEGTETYL